MRVGSRLEKLKSSASSAYSAVRAFDFCPEPRNSHHDVVAPFLIASDDGVLHVLQIAAHQVQSVDAGFEILRQPPEQRRDLRVFEELELGDDVIALLAGFHKVNEVLDARATQPLVIDALREHSGEEQRHIANVLAHLALAVE